MHRMALRFLTPNCDFAEWGEVSDAPVVPTGSHTSGH